MKSLVLLCRGFETRGAAGPPLLHKEVCLRSGIQNQEHVGMGLFCQAGSMCLIPDCGGHKPQRWWKISLQPPRPMLCLGKGQCWLPSTPPLLPSISYPLQPASRAPSCCLVVFKRPGCSKTQHFSQINGFGYKTRKDFNEVRQVWLLLSC